MKDKTIPQRIIDMLKVRPCTAVELCQLVYQDVDRTAIRAMHVHIHRAKLIAPIRTSSLYDGRKESGRPAVLYSLE
jgi:hypothetical protein